MRSPMLVLLAAGCVWGADADYNGRWDITAATRPRPRAWWLELTGVGGAKPAGKFVSAYAGDMNVIDAIGVEEGELRFTIRQPAPPNQKQNAPRNFPFRARLVNGKLEGAEEAEG